MSLRGQRKRKSRGWVPPGYNYLGPFNSLYAGKPTNHNDRVANEHDWKYYFLEKQNKKPKLQYSEADDTFLKKLKPNDIPTRAAKILFTAKRKLAERGWLTDLRPSQRSKRESSPNDYQQFITPPTNNKRQRSIEPKEDNKRQRSLIASFINSLDSDTMSTENNQGSGTGSGLKETPVDSVPQQVYRGPPDFVFASLPIYIQRRNSGNVNTYDNAFRLTSPYDPFVNSGTLADLNPGTGVTSHQETLPSNSTDASQVPARWFDYYASIYKYYHVISCRYEIYVENLTNDDMWVHLMPTNDVYPPVNATNTDMLLWSDCESVCLSGRALPILASGIIERVETETDKNVNMDEVQPPASTAPNYEDGNHILNTIGKPAHLFRGTYSPGDYKRQIRLDENVENWTAVNTNPTLVERLLLRAKIAPESWSNAGDTQSRNRPLEYLVRVKMEYLVEFKELRDGLKYPVNDQPYIATIKTTN